MVQTAGINIVCVNDIVNCFRYFTFLSQHCSNKKTTPNTTCYGVVYTRHVKNKAVVPGSDQEGAQVHQTRTRQSIAK